MIKLETENIFCVQIAQPDYETFLKYNELFHGCYTGLYNAMSYFHDSFMIKDEDFSKAYKQCAIDELNCMNLFAQYLHGFAGQENNYYDVLFNDTPEYVHLKNKKTSPLPIPKEHNDITAATILHIQEENKQIKIWEQLKEEDHSKSNIKEFIQYVLLKKEEIIQRLTKILEELKNPDGVKDFGIMPESVLYHSLNNGNYLEKPNPKFIQK